MKKDQARVDATLGQGAKSTRSHALDRITRTRCPRAAQGNISAQTTTVMGLGITRPSSTTLSKTPRLATSNSTTKSKRNSTVGATKNSLLKPAREPPQNNRAKGVTNRPVRQSCIMNGLPITLTVSGEVLGIENLFLFKRAQNRTIPIEAVFPSRFLCVVSALFLPTYPT